MHHTTPVAAKRQSGIHCCDSELKVAACEKCCAAHANLLSNSIDDSSPTANAAPEETPESMDAHEFDQPQELHYGLEGEVPPTPEPVESLTQEIIEESALEEFGGLSESAQRTEDEAAETQAAEHSDGFSLVEEPSVVVEKIDAEELQHESHQVLEYKHEDLDPVLKDEITVETDMKLIEEQANAPEEYSLQLDEHTDGKFSEPIYDESEANSENKAPTNDRTRKFDNFAFEETKSVEREDQGEKEIKRGTVKGLISMWNNPDELAKANANPNKSYKTEYGVGSGKPSRQLRNNWCE